MSLSHLGLDALFAIGRLGTIVRAAQELGVTQTALTQRIKLLELEVGRPLFVRSRRGMEPTAEGRLLLRYCEDRARLENQVLNSLGAGGTAHPVRLRISGPTLQVQRRLLPVLSQVREAFPNAFFDFDIDDSRNLGRKLSNLEADLVLTPAPVGKHPHKKLTPSRFVLAGPWAWRGRAIEAIVGAESIIDFNPEDPYTETFLRRHRLLPKGLPERHFINNTHQMLELVERGFGYAVFDERDVLPRVKLKRMVNLCPALATKTDWYLSWHFQGGQLPPLTETLVALVD